MKTFKRILLLIVITFLFNNCDEIAVNNVQLPVSFKVTQKILIPENPDSNATNSFIVGGEYDIMTLPEVSGVATTPEEIKKIKITKIDYRFSNFSGNTDAVVSGELLLPKISKTTPEDVIAHFAINSVNVANSIDANQQFTFEGDYDGVNEFLSQNTVLQFAIQGVSTQNPALFDLELIVSAVVTTDVNIDL